MTAPTCDDGKTLPSIHLEDLKDVDRSGKDGTTTPQLYRRLERKTVLKLDLLLVPLMCGLYLLAFMDRANIGNTRVAGLQEDLKMSDHQYQTGMTRLGYATARPQS
jgi:hypothetical protein